MKHTTSITLLTTMAVAVMSAQSANAQQELFNHDHSHDSLHTASGMLLGVYAQTMSDGLTITGTIPGYSAEGRLFAGDILLKATSSGMPTFTIRTHQDMENAKSQIGPNREAAIEFYRPNVGTQYAWVTFKPIGGGAVLHGHDDGHPHVFNEPAPSPQVGQPFVQNPGLPSGSGFPSNPNNQTPFSSNFPGNPNNFQPKIGNPNNTTPSTEFVPTSPNNASPHSDFKPSTPNNITMRSEMARPGTGQFQAEFQLESERPGARLLFKNPSGIQLNTPPQTQFTPQTRFPQNGLPQASFPQGSFEQQQGSTPPQTRNFQFRGRGR